MNSNKIIISGIAGGVAYFLLGWLIYGIVLSDFMAANGNQCIMRPMEQMIWWAMIVSNIAGGLLLAFILSWANCSSVASGVRIGAIIGLLLGISIDLSFYSMSTLYLNMTGVIVDIAVTVFMMAAIAAVVAWVMGMGKK